MLELASAGSVCRLGSDALRIAADALVIEAPGRRLVARNEFRNTLNAFTGLDLQWTSPARDLARAFAVMPIVRLPSDPEGLKNNSIVEASAERMLADSTL